MRLDFLASTLAFDAAAPAPKYRQLYARLRDEILLSRLAAGTRMPATRALSASLGISRNTVKVAYELLQAEGYLVSRQGSGSHVAAIEQEVLERTQQREMRRKYARPLLGKRAHILTSPDRSYSPGAPRAFQPGVPAVDLFPHALWARLIGRAARHPDLAMLGNAFQSNLPRLRRTLASYLSATRGIRAEPEQIIITPSAQAAFDLITTLVVDIGDDIWIENPCYIRARAAFEAAGANLVPIDVDADGMDPDAVSGSRPRLIYVTPSHQCPTGVTMPLARRLRLLEAAMKAQAFIIEDDYDSEIRYDARPVAALQGMGGRDHVLYVGTFSKTMMPAIRAGYIVAPPDVAGALEAAQRYTGHLVTASVQIALADFVEEGYYKSHIRKMRAVYRQRRDLLLARIGETLTSFCEVNEPSGGLQATVLFYDDVDDVGLARELINAGIGCLPVSRNYLVKPRQGLYLGFGAPNEEEINQGVKTLSRVIRDWSIQQQGKGAGNPG